MKKTTKIFSLLIIIIISALLIFYLYPTTKIKEGVIIDKFVVYKSKRVMEIYSKGHKVATYKIALGREPIGHKQVEGDGKTPEGTYTINDRNPHSGYHKNLGISYPNEQDRITAAAMGQKPGGYIKIHGLKNGKSYIGRFHLLTDWTNGCIAVDNVVMDQLYEHVGLGAIIEINK